MARFHQIDWHSRLLYWIGTGIIVALALFWHP